MIIAYGKAFALPEAILNNYKSTRQILEELYL